MNLLVNTNIRTYETEIMDDFSIDGEVLYDALDKLAIINRLLGGNRVTIDGLKTLLRNQPKDRPMVIIDLGCGGGDILRAIAKFGKREGYNFHLIGLDANNNTLSYAAKLCTGFDNIEFRCIDVFSEEFNGLEFDIAITTLFLHHFEDAQLMRLMEHLFKRAKLGLVVNDLHRHRLAYYLFKLISIPIKNKMIVQDGLTSVLRGFKRKELENISQQLNAEFQLKWKWAFRYQWILKR